MVSEMRRYAFTFLTTLQIFSCLGHEECYTSSQKSGECRLAQLCPVDTTAPPLVKSNETATNLHANRQESNSTNSQCDPPKICCPTGIDSTASFYDATEISGTTENEEEATEAHQREDDCKDHLEGCLKDLDVVEKTLIKSNASNHNSSDTSLVGENVSNNTGTRFGFSSFGPIPSFPLFQPPYPFLEKTAVKPPDTFETEFKPIYLNTNVGNAKNMLPAFCGVIDSPPRVFHGSEVIDGEIPWIVALLYDRGNGDIVTECGGSLITQRHVLTAAHCVKGLVIPESWNVVSVRLGSTNIGYDPKCSTRPPAVWGPRPKCPTEYTDIPVVDKIVHERYNSRAVAPPFDIALLVLGQEIFFTQTVRPICLPQNPTISQKLITAGWGRTETREKSQHLLKVDLPLANQHQCAEVYKTQYVNLTSHQICVGGQSQKDSCYGDSGGPLMDPHEIASNAYRIVGITSFGPRNCGTPGWPAVYTKVFDFVPWILKTIESLKNARSGALPKSRRPQQPQNNRSQRKSHGNQSFDIRGKSH